MVNFNGLFGCIFGKNPGCYANDLKKHIYPTCIVNVLRTDDEMDDVFKRNPGYVNHVLGFRGKPVFFDLLSYWKINEQTTFEGKRNISGLVQSLIKAWTSAMVC